MLNSRQRAQLRGLANSYETIIHIGKSGITDNLVEQTETALYTRELIKAKVLENSPFTVRESADELAEKCQAEVVQVIGSKFILYKHSKNKNIKSIILVK